VPGCAQAPCQLVAVHVGQADVEDAHVRHAPGRHPQRAVRIVLDQHLVAEILEHHRQQLGGIHIVVDNQHHAPARGGRQGLGRGPGS